MQQINKIQSIFLLLSIIFTTDLLAQKSGIEITGKVLESKSQQAVPFATVVVLSNQDQKVLTGSTTDDEGFFSIQSNSDDIYIEISFIGFATEKITELNIINGKLDLGTVLLTENSQSLDEVVVQGEKSQTVFKLDKRVFNVGQDLSSTGASALEILNNVPSVNVNIEGEISLRGGSGVQILINGKPSVLASDGGNALGSITADMIDRIEVITNPSAKYEAEGTSGIINIVIKKDERKGVNGSVSLNTGYPHNHSVGLSLNRRSEKFNLFSQLGAGYRELPRKTEAINQDLETGRTILSNGKEYRNEAFVNLILGADYHINETNVLTLSGSFAYEFEKQPSTTNFSSLENDSLISEWYRTESTDAGNPKLQYELQYQKDFKDHEDHKLTMSALGNFFGKDQSSEFSNTTTSGNLSDSYQQTETEFNETKYTYQVDYARPFNEQFSMEAGGQFVMHDVNNDYLVADLENEVWVTDSGLTNIFNYDQKVLGVYGTGAYEGDRWGIKAGLRFEYTNLNTKLENTGETNKQNYHNFFPSLHVSYKASERLSLQTGYSRRIYRPRLWDLNPFFNIRNNYSIRAGNPELQPEFTNSYETNLIYILDKASFNLGIYHRHTIDLIERVSTFENNVNTYKPTNFGTNRATGVEFNFKYSPTDWMTLNSDLNYNFFIRKGTFDDVSFDFNAHRWSTKINAKFKIPADFEFELTGNYQSKYKTAQGETADNIYADVGLRKKIKGGKVVLNMSVRDVFGSRNRETEVSTEDFYAYSFGKRGPFVTFGFSYGFGKGEAMQYSGARRR